MGEASRVGGGGVARGVWRRIREEWGMRDRGEDCGNAVGDVGRRRAWCWEMQARSRVIGCCPVAGGRILGLERR